MGHVSSLLKSQRKTMAIYRNVREYLRIFLTCSVVLSLNLYSNDREIVDHKNLDDDFFKLVKNFRLPTQRSNQIYCILNAQEKNEKIELWGDRPKAIIHPASVSKVPISLYILRHFTPSYQYKTKFYLSEGHLHIKGSKDPYFDKDKFFEILQLIQHQKLGTIHTLSFDENFIFFPAVEYHTEFFPSHSITQTQKVLTQFFNHQLWNQYLKNAFVQYFEKQKDGATTPEKPRIDQIQFLHSSRLNSIPNKFQLAFEMKSPEIYKYIKEMNVKSNNYLAQFYFQELGGEQKFNQWFHQYFNTTKKEHYFYTGSGLPLRQGKKRYDNYSTCELMTKVTSTLDELIQSYYLELKDLLAVPGTDGGTFKRRNYPTELKNSFVAKTGTLNHVSTLSGALYTNLGTKYFGIFNGIHKKSNAHRLQDNFIQKMMHFFDGPKSFHYESKNFVSLEDESEFVDEEE